MNMYFAATDIQFNNGFEPEWACTLLPKLGMSFTRTYTTMYMRRPPSLNGCLRACLRDLISRFLTKLNGINDDLAAQLIQCFKDLSNLCQSACDHFSSFLGLSFHLFFFLVSSISISFINYFNFKSEFNQF
jgi:hypothetical protein